MRQGGQDSSTAHALPAVGAEGRFQAQGFHWAWVAGVVFKISAMSHTVKVTPPMTVSCCLGAVSVFSFCFQEFCCAPKQNRLVRCTEKETARQGQYHFTHTSKAKAIAAAPPQFFTPFISASKYLATKQIFPACWIPKCHCSGHGTQYSEYFCHFFCTFDAFRC